MSTSRLAHLRCLSVLLVLMLSWQVHGQSLLPLGEGDRCRFDATIEMERAYVSGMCVLLREGDVIKGCIFNEFGITALDFTYQPRKGKVKLHSVLPMLDKWYIRRTLRGDLKRVMQALDAGNTRYENQRRHITYLFTPVATLDTAPPENEPSL